MAHGRRARRPDRRPDARPRSATTTCSNCSTELNKGRRDAVRGRRRPARVRPRGARRRERRRRRRAAPGFPNAEINGRLTMRDVILARHGAGVQTWNAAGRQLRHPAGSARSSVRPLPIKRGWTATDAKVRGSHAVPLRQHPPGGVRQPLIRASGAGERAGRPGRPGDEHAAGRPARRPQLRRRHRRAGRPAGLRTCSTRACVERSTNDPLSCCLKSSLLAVGDGGSIADFDHQVDHVMTRDPKQVDAEELVGDRPASRSTASGTPTTRACSAPCGSRLAMMPDGPELRLRPRPAALSPRRRCGRRIRRLLRPARR